MIIGDFQMGDTSPVFGKVWEHNYRYYACDIEINCIKGEIVMQVFCNKFT